MHFNGQSLAMFWNNCLLLQRFGVKNAIIDFFFQKMVLSVVFMKLKCRRLHTSLRDSKKHQTIEVLLRVDFFLQF